MSLPRPSITRIALGATLVCSATAAVAQRGDWGIPAGGESRTIDLEGTDRVIRSLEFWYDAKTVPGRRAVVRLSGRP